MKELFDDRVRAIIRSECSRFDLALRIVKAEDELLAQRSAGAREMRERAARWHDEQAHLADRRIALYVKCGMDPLGPDRLLSETRAKEQRVEAAVIRALPDEPEPEEER